MREAKTKAAATSACKQAPAAEALEPHTASMPQQQHPKTVSNHTTMPWRQLRADEIEPRLVDGTAEGAKLLLHARPEAVRRILDEGVGALNWTCYHYAHGGTLFCKVGIYDARIADFTYRSNVGAPPDGGFEKEHGAATDAFKRAARMWGIGDELMLPTIIVPIALCETYNKGNQPYIKSKAHTLTEIEYGQAGTPVRLVLRSQSGKVFTWDART